MAERSTPQWLGHALAGLLLAALQGCGTPSQSLSMAISSADALQLRTWVPEGLKHNIELDRVKGGDETSMWWGSRVSGMALEQALEDSLRSVGMLVPVAGAKYQLRVQMLSLVQPIVAADLTVTTTIHYVLVDKQDGTVLYQRSVRNAATAELGDALLSQPERARLANEAAVRANIAMMLRDLMGLRLP